MIAEVVVDIGGHKIVSAIANSAESLELTAGDSVAVIVESPRLRSASRVIPPITCTLLGATPASFPGVIPDWLPRGKSIA